jgi:hypothetical protein
MTSSLGDISLSMVDVAPDDVVDRFVASLRADAIHTEAIATAPWIAAFETRLPFPLPKSYASLVGRYRFAPFERGGLRLFGNLGDGSREDLVFAATNDPFLWKPLATAGLLQIGRLDTGSYDPVCLDGRQMKHRREYPLVLLDHEAALQFGRIVVRRQIDDSFLSFMDSNSDK